MADGYPQLTWDEPTRRSTLRGWLMDGPRHGLLMWEGHKAGADDYDADGNPLAPGAYVLAFLGGGPCDHTTHDDIDAAKTHAEATLRMRGML